MTEPFEFTLLFRLSADAAEPESHLDALFEAGCDDAVIGTGRAGYIALDFDREGTDAGGAIQSAIGDVERAVPGAELVEVRPDMVGATEVARLAHCSRQNVRLHLTGKGDVPPPAHGGSTILWHLAELAPFLEERTPLRIGENHIGVARTAMRINAGIMRRRASQLVSA